VVVVEEEGVAVQMIVIVMDTIDGEPGVSTIHMNKIWMIMILVLEQYNSFGGAES